MRASARLASGSVTMSKMISGTERREKPFTAALALLRHRANSGWGGTPGDGGSEQTIEQRAARREVMALGTVWGVHAATWPSK